MITLERDHLQTRKYPATAPTQKAEGQKAVAGIHSALQPVNCTKNTVVMCSPSHFNLLLGNFPV